VLFDFPLVDGKTWQDRGRTVTAREEEIAVPGGTARGFVMETSDGTERWTYAPAIGYVVEHTLTVEGEVKLHAVLQSFGRSSGWVWYETLTHLVDESDSASLGSIDVGADADALVVYAGGVPGARGTLVPPIGSGREAWTFEATEGERTFADVLDPATGTWSYVLATAPDTDVYLNAAAVRWLAPRADAPL
jgi:hypothetical protein